MSKTDFKQRCMAVLYGRGFGFINTVSTDGSRETDLIAIRDERKCYFHCVKSLRPLDEETVKETAAEADSHGCDRAIVVTNSGFTGAAQALAREMNVALWDRAPLSPIGPRTALLAVLLGLVLAALVFLISLRSRSAAVPAGPVPEATPAATAESTLPPRSVSTPEPSPTPEPTPEPTPTPEPDFWKGNLSDSSISYTRTSAKEMLNALRSNPAAAVETYNGKYLKMTGFAAATQPEERRFTVEAEQFAQSKSTVLCLISNDEQLEWLNKMPAGQYVTLYGLCTATAEGYALRLHSLTY